MTLGRHSVSHVVAWAVFIHCTLRFPLFRAQNRTKESDSTIRGDVLTQTLMP